MKVQLKVFGQVKQVAGSDVVELDPGGGPALRVADLRRCLAERFPEAAAVVDHALFAIDNEYVDDQTPLSETAEIACIPPVSGG